MIFESIAYQMAARQVEYDTVAQAPELLILTIVSALASRYGKDYCFPSQEKICELLGHYGRHMSRRTLNRHLNALVRQGWIKRQRRHQRCAERGYTFRSSLYTLTRRAFRWLSGLAQATKRATNWGGAFARNTRVSNSAQYIPSRDIHTGGALKSGAPPGPEDSVARSARTNPATKHDPNDSTVYQHARAALEAVLPLPRRT